jgi:sugar lactone lactonase YvrE
MSMILRRTKLLAVFAAASTLLLAGARGAANAQVQEGPRLDFPAGLATDGYALYVASGRNNTIGRIDLSSRTLSIAAGQTFKEGSNDGTGASALFASPSGMVIVGGDLYIADTKNSDIRKMNLASKVVTTVAGTANISGGQDGKGPVAHFNLPSQITSDGAGMLYISDTYNNTVRSFQLSDGMVKTIGGQSGVDGKVEGPATESKFSLPTGIATDGRAVYVADTGNNVIRKIELPSLQATTIAGTGEEGRQDGPGAQAQFASPKALVITGTTLYILDADNHAVRKLDTTTNQVSTLSHLTGHLGSGAALSSDKHWLYVSDTTENSVQQVDTTNGNFTTLYPP